MTVRREMVEWRVASARSETRVTCELSPCQSRFSPVSPVSLSQASAIAAEAFMNNAG